MPATDRPDLDKIVIEWGFPPKLAVNMAHAGKVKMLALAVAMTS